MASGHLTCWFWKFSIILHSMHMKHFFSELMLFSFRSIRSCIFRRVSEKPEMCEEGGVN